MASPRSRLATIATIVAGAAIVVAGAAYQFRPSSSSARPLSGTAIRAQQAQTVPCAYAGTTLTCDLSGIVATWTVSPSSTPSVPTPVPATATSFASPTQAATATNSIPTATVTPFATRTPTPTAVPTATNTPPPLLILDQIIAWRGNHNPPHEITLANPMYCCYSWGQHATEDTPAISGTHSVNAWIDAFRQGSDATPPNARLNVRRLAIWVYTSGHWVKGYDGNLLGQWLQTSNADTSGDYQPISYTVESDGSLSFPLPPAPRAIHLGSNAPGLQFSGSSAVLVIVEARILGTATWGIAPGADFRDSAGDGSTIQQSCWGHLALLASSWRTISCLSSSMTDAQIIASNPPTP